MLSPCASVPPGGMDILQLSTRAHILNALAIGPKVPWNSNQTMLFDHHTFTRHTAISGNPVEANHHRLR